MHFDHIKKLKHYTALALLALLPGLAACAAIMASSDKPTLPTVQVLVGKYSVKAELADTNQSRQTGLMNRAYLPSNNGMLFVFDRSETQCMWMKNTLIDLDVAFADESGRILNVEQMKAGTTDIHCSRGNAKLALEVNQNWFLERSLGTGDSIEIIKQ